MDIDVADRSSKAMHEPVEVRVCLCESKKRSHRSVREDSEEDFRWEVGEIVDLCGAFLLLSTLSSHVHGQALALPAVLLVGHGDVVLGDAVDALRRLLCRDWAMLGIGFLFKDRQRQTLDESRFSGERNTCS